MRFSNGVSTTPLNLINTLDGNFICFKNFFKSFLICCSDSHLKINSSIGSLLLIYFGCFLEYLYLL